MRILAFINNHPILVTSKEAFMAAKNDHDEWMRSAQRSALEVTKWSK